MIRHRIYHTILVFIGLTMFFACNPQRNADQLLHEAQSLMDTKPDSAMILIDSIFYPENSLKKERYMQYLVAKVQAKWLCDKDIKDDTDIFEARRYFNKNPKNPMITSLSNLYSGCVYEEIGENDLAMDAYKQAFDVAATTGDSLIMGRIQQYMGRLLSSQGLYEKAIEAYRKAAYINKGMPEKQANNFSAIGRMSLIMGETDSAFFYFEKGIEIAKQSDKQEMLCQLYQNLSISYRETGDYEKSEKYLRLSLQMNTDSNEITRYNLNFASLYLLMGESDSCTYYENLLKKEMNTVKNEKLLASIYSFLSRKANTENNYDSAYFYLQKSSSLKIDIMENRLQQKVYEVQQKYDYESLQNTYNRKKINLQRWIMLFSFLFLMAAVVIIIFVRRLSLKRRNEIETKNALLKLGRKASYLTERINDKENKLNDSRLLLEQANQKLRGELLWRFNVLQGISLLRNTKTKDNDTMMKNLCRIVYGTSKINDFDFLLDVFDRMNPNLTNLIRKYFPGLKDTEFKVFVLSYTGLKRQEIADILGLKVSSIDKALKSIRIAIAAKGTDEFNLDLPQNLKSGKDE